MQPVVQGEPQAAAARKCLDTPRHCAIGGSDDRLLLGLVRERQTFANDGLVFRRLETDFLDLGVLGTE
jgi:hypothetical protein